MGLSRLRLECMADAHLAALRATRIASSIRVCAAAPTPQSLIIYNIRSPVLEWPWVPGLSAPAGPPRVLVSKLLCAASPPVDGSVDGFCTLVQFTKAWHVGTIVRLKCTLAALFKPLTMMSIPLRRLSPECVAAAHVAALSAGDLQRAAMFTLQPRRAARDTRCTTTSSPLMQTGGCNISMASERSRRDPADPVGDANPARAPADPTELTAGGPAIDTSRGGDVCGKQGGLAGPEDPIRASAGDPAGGAAPGGSEPNSDANPTDLRRVLVSGLARGGAAARGLEGALLGCAHVRSPHAVPGPGVVCRACYGRHHGVAAASP